MIKTPLIAKCILYDFKNLFNNKGYAFFTKGFYNVNIIGIRANSNSKVTNKFDDVLVIDYNTSICHKRHVYQITTEPGTTYMRNPLNSNGAAILAPGQYRGAYAIGIHNGKYKALCQRLKPVKVYRDNNKDNIYDLYPNNTQYGMYGINIHRSTKYTICDSVDNYSAGCQVFANPKDFNSFMRILEKAKDIYGNTFTYTLLDENDLI